MKKYFSFLAPVLFFPHLVLFWMSGNKPTIVRDLYARTFFKKSLLSQSIDLAKELMFNTYFRNLFYFRNRGLFSNLLRVFWPQNSTFTIDIHSKIGAGLQLAHPYSTIINAKSIGEDCYINHLVTVGEKQGGKPVIGDKVQLHAGSIIIGDIKIANGAIIGAGAVVVKDVPENSIVAGNPAKVIKMMNPQH